MVSFNLGGSFWCCFDTPKFVDAAAGSTTPCCIAGNPREDILALLLVVMTTSPAELILKQFPVIRRLSLCDDGSCTAARFLRGLLFAAKGLVGTVVLALFCLACWSKRYKNDAVYSS